MRDGILQLAKLLLLALLIGGGSLAVKGTVRNVDFGKLQADVEAAAEVSGLNQENAQLLRRFYGLNGGERGSLDPVYSPGQYVRRRASAGGMQLGKPGGTGAGGCPGAEGRPR